MLKNILIKAYEYTKSHKFLWLFGIPFMGFISVNFVKLFLEKQILANKIFDIVSHIHHKPTHLVITTAGLIILLILASILGAWFRAAIIWSVFNLENHKEISFKRSLNKTTKHIVILILLGLIATVTMLLVLLWVSIPIFVVVGKGLVFRGVILSIIGACVFVPVCIILSLVNMFAASFRVIYGMSFYKALQSGFDLLAHSWFEALQLMASIGVVYIYLMAISASILTTGGTLSSAWYLKTPLLSGNYFFAIMALLGCIVSVILFFCNSVLNAFTNIVWTLYFLEKTNIQKKQEDSVMLAAQQTAEEPAVSSSIQSSIKGG